MQTYRKIPVPRFAEDQNGISHGYLQEGIGTPFVFQHGLGGSANQAFEVFGQLPGIYLYSLDFQGHGSTGMANLTSPTLSELVEDQIWFSIKVVQEPHAMGGLSLGSLVALKIALNNPSLITNLILLRPAWPTSQCQVDFVALKSAIPAHLHALLDLDPGFKLSELSAIEQPVMILGMPDDDLHPISFARQLADYFPSAAFHQVPSKRTDEKGYRDSIRKHTLAFLNPK